MEDKLLELQWRLDKQYSQKLQLELSLQIEKQKNEQFEGELQIVQWYLAVMEDGFDSREVVKSLAEERVVTKLLRQDLAKERNRSEAKTSKLKTKLSDTRTQLVKLNEEVAKPLIQEVKLAHEMNTRYRE